MSTRHNAANLRDVAEKRKSHWQLKAAASATQNKFLPADNDQWTAIIDSATLPVVAARLE